MSRSPVLPVVLALAGLATASGPALAQPGTAPAGPTSATADRCAAGLEAERAGALALAFLDLEACIDGDGDTADHRAAHRRVKGALDSGEFALVTIATSPDDAVVDIAPLGRTVATGRVYLSPGTYTLGARSPGHAPVSRTVEVTGRYRETVELVLARERTGTTATTTVDLTGDAPGRTEIARGKDPEHENLLPDRFRQAQPNDVGGDRVARRSRWPYWALGVGLAAVGAGVALHLDDNAGAATALYATGGAGVVLGATGLLLRW